MLSIPSPNDSISSRRQKLNGKINRPVLVVSPQACEAESLPVSGVLRPTNESTGADGDLPEAVQLCRELLPPPPVSPRVRKMARSLQVVGEDRTQNGTSEQAGSLGWFLQRREGSSSTAKRRKSNEGLSLSFVTRFVGLNVGGDESERAQAEPASFRNLWKTNNSFSDSGSSAQSSFNGSFGSHTTATTVCQEQSLDTSHMGSPLSIAATEPWCSRSSAAPRRRSWIPSFSDSGSNGSLTGKRQRSPGGMIVDDDASLPFHTSWGMFAAPSLQLVSDTMSPDAVDGGSGGPYVHSEAGAEQLERDIVPPLLALPPKGASRKLKDHKAYSL